MAYKCVGCGSTKVHSIEFRIDYTNARSIRPVNERGYYDKDYITNRDLPYYLEGYYCEGCKELVSVD